MACSASTLRIKHAFEKGHWRILQITLESGWLEASVSSQWDQGDYREAPRGCKGRWEGVGHGQGLASLAALAPHAAHRSLHRPSHLVGCL